MFIDPMNTTQLANAMRRIRDDQVLADTLIIKGFQRARVFSWDTCARATADLYINMAR
jgi:glycosyltransferase involved in cell wall biosynthesis